MTREARKTEPPGRSSRSASCCYRTPLGSISAAGSSRVGIIPGVVSNRARVLFVSMFAVACVCNVQPERRRRFHSPKNPPRASRPPSPQTSSHVHPPPSPPPRDRSSAIARSLCPFRTLLLSSPRRVAITPPSPRLRRRHRRPLRRRWREGRRRSSPRNAAPPWARRRVAPWVYAAWAPAPQAWAWARAPPLT